jgi:UDP-MurNAc hydroxylase
MIIKLYRSATIGLEISGKKILFDPWLVDGEYLGAWSHYPYFDLDNNLNEINTYDAIYISHIHPDHCSDKTLKRINKDIPVYIHKYHSKFLKFKIERLGFNVFELQNGKKNEIFKNVNINIFAADNCNPELCYKLLGCADASAKDDESQQIDSLVVIDDGKEVLVNVNDCPYELAQSTIPYILKQYDKIDILMSGYGGAGCYPQCFENLDYSQKIISAKNKEKQFLNQALNFINNLNPKLFLPCAGTYTLTGKLSKLQNLRGVPSIDEAYAFFDKTLTSAKTIKLNPDSSFDTLLQEYEKKYITTNTKDYENYIQNNLMNKKLDYENCEEPELDEVFDYALKAHKKYIEKKLLNKNQFDHDIILKIENKGINLSKDNTIDLIDIEKSNLKSKYVLYDMDSRLLKWLLMGPKYAHWNNAEIGSHIKFFRKPDQFERNVYASMWYMHN